MPLPAADYEKNFTAKSTCICNSHMLCNACWYFVKVLVPPREVIRLVAPGHFTSGDVSRYMGLKRSIPPSSSNPELGPHLDDI